MKIDEESRIQENDVEELKTVVVEYSNSFGMYHPPQKNFKEMIHSLLSYQYYLKKNLPLGNEVVRIQQSRRCKQLIKANSVIK